MHRVGRSSLQLCQLKNKAQSKKCNWLMNNLRFCSGADNNKNNNASAGDKKVREKAVETDSKSPNEKTKAAKNKLMSLLSDMTASNFAARSSPSVQLSRPTQHPKKKDKKAEEEVITSQEMISAVKSVASLAGSEAEKIEADLTEGIQSISLIAKEETLETEDDPEISQQLEEVESDVTQEHIMASAVEAVAAHISDAPEEAQSELTKKLLTLASKSGAENVETERLKNIFKGMRVDRGTETAAINAFPEHKFVSEKSAPKFLPPEETIDLFGDAPLNIFNVAEESEKAKDSVFWGKLQEKQLKSLVTFAPTNAFQEMIQLTEQGKHWKFPIDNFSEIGPEENVGFHEHVFLEHHLHGFPKKGPIRHFMELVCTGLSKNPYITVERKIENIEWFRQYFKDKEHILQEYGVLDDSSNAIESK